MRDAVDLKDKKINYKEEEYIIKAFYYTPNSGQIYVKLKNSLTKLFLNVSLITLLDNIKTQIKL
jgi:hypothetical protein